MAAKKSNGKNSGGGEKAAATGSGGRQTPKKKPQKSSAIAWIKENPKAAKLVLLGVLLVILAVVAISFFSGGEDDKPKREPGASRPPARKTPTAPGLKTPLDDESEKTPGEEEQPKAPETEPPPEEKPERPEDVSKWMNEDFYDARKEGDPKLVEAVGLLGQRARGNANVAVNLAKLLEPLPEEEPVEPKVPPSGRPPQVIRPRPGRTNTDLIEALVEALGANGTDEARGFLVQILAGTLPNDDDKTAVDAALETLVDNACPENEAILLRALTMAEQLREAGRGEITAEELRTKTLKLVESTASAQFRVKLAEYLLAANTPQTLQPVVGKFLEAEDPENLDAQLVFYKDEKWTGKIQAPVEEYFTNFSSTAMREMLGIPAEAVGKSPRTSPYPGRTPGSKKTEEPDPELPYRLARTLWSAAPVAIVESRLGQLDSLETQEQLVALGSTIPVDSMRTAVYDALSRNFSDGPSGLESTGVPKTLITDPGLLPVVKMLVKKQTSTRATAIEQRDKFLQAKEDWANFVPDSVRAWCDRFHAVAAAQAEADRLAGKAPGTSLPPGALPIELHPEAKPSAVYYLDWPGADAEKLTGVTPGPLKICYLRIEENARAITREGYYKRQLYVRESATIEKSVWIETFRAVPQTDRIVSIDVLLTRAAESGDGDSAEAEDLVIEILTIEMNDPAKSGT
ncbi:MAG TPA: hypothetical protein VMY42_23365 [Thermoguttaceae bacterium]|nr:hypothetical protein [Thermoguttaceae bacterium]